MDKDIKVCKKCVLNSSFPGISFSEEGVCNHCNSPRKEKEKVEMIREDTEAKFLELIKKLKQDRKDTGYDCLLAFSGGKDSTYTLNLLKNKYGLEILTYTFDNGFLSNQAKDNIKNISEKLGVDNIIFEPRIDLLGQMFINAIKNENMYSQAALMRASAVCTTCINFIRYHLLKVCIEKDIPMMIFGWAPGQIDQRSVIMQPNKRFLQKAQEVFTNAHQTVLASHMDKYLLTAKAYDSEDISIPYFVNPLMFNEYDFDKVQKTILELGWKYPDNTDASSTNCLLNTLGNYVHEKRYGYNPYSEEISELIREGKLTREEGLDKLNKQTNRQVLEACLTKLGIKEDDIC
ncbi:argininosuccinate synthase domain-containing protein [Cellulosilyticum ruminicola]|uniref:argininosuccinate synthase domain-containing protein n=1 Tax=Cellulosilyticum ruminicola TaxID=425254 RepID=UPI0006D218D3|nr:argininosuccinate synthase domain-containing protein [Cellulosilyticum ruminicola]